MIRFSRSIGPACLEMNINDQDPSVKLIVTGWGSTSAERRLKFTFHSNKYSIEFKSLLNKGTIQSQQLRKTQLTSMPLQECNRTFLNYNQRVDQAAFRQGIFEGQYCAYDPEGRNDSCSGDSGGPLQYFPNNESTVANVVGIVSFGISCGTELPGIYTRIAYYLDWIEPIVWPNQ